MKTTKQNLRVGPTLIAMAVLAAIGQAQAQQSDEVKQLTNPDSSVTIGAAGVSGDMQDRAQYGMFNGMRKDGGYVLFDIDYLTRDNATGTWTMLQGRNLGLNSRELRGGMNRQGDWKIIGEYNEITRYSPFTINTAMGDVGTSRPNIRTLAVAGSGSDYDFKLQRKSLGGTVEKWLSPNLKFEATFKNEDKTGTRLWGRGYDCASYVCGTSTTTAMNQANFLKNAILLIPEPVDSTIRQIDAKFNFHDEKLNLTAGYYASFYTNSYGNISPIVPNSLYGGNQTLVGALYPAVGTNIIAGGGTSLQNVLQSPMALPPENQAHQFSLAGNYAFTKSTRATFKYHYTHATQNQDYASMGLGAGAPTGSLNGRVDTIATQMGLTSRITKDLNVLANVSYSRKEDKTPNALYNVEAKAIFPATTPTSYTNVNQIGVPGAVWNNNHVSNKRLLGKLEASYRLPENFRVTVGADYDEHERLVPESRVEEALAGLGPLREKNTEKTYRIDLRRSMSETLNGSIGVSTSNRGGSDWTNLSTLNPDSPTPNSALNTYLINTFCGGRECYGQVLPASVLLQLNGNTPFPASMADVKRDKVKVTLDWNPTEQLSVQLLAEDGKDKNDMPINDFAGGKGWRDSRVNFYSLDVSYVFTPDWRLSAYASDGEQTMHLNHSTGYMMDLKNRSEAFGLAVVGQATKQLQVGASLTYINDVNKYGVAAASGLGGNAQVGFSTTPPSAANLAQAAVGLPDVVFRKTLVSLYGLFTLNKNADIRVDVANQKTKYSDWVWGTTNAPFVFSDNTSVKQQVDQTVTFVGVTYVYKFR